MTVRTAVIPAAGRGTRFLPLTGAVPKELLPLGSVPALQYVLDEAVGAGIDRVVLVVSEDKDAIRRYLVPFLTAMSSPLSGWTASVKESSVKAWWTSITSPVSTNL